VELGVWAWRHHLVIPPFQIAVTRIAAMVQGASRIIVADSRSRSRLRVIIKEVIDATTDHQ
jgi:hypothetical protein